MEIWLIPNREDDSKWPQKNKDGRQELEIRMGSEHISFEVHINNNLRLQLHTDPAPCLDGQNWLSGRCYRISRPRGPSCVLLPCPRSEGTGLLSHCITFQNQAHLEDKRIRGYAWQGGRRSLSRRMALLVLRKGIPEMSIHEG